MIISGGVNIYPAEIEAELSCHPAVADVAVFGIPHDDWGEEIKAVVEPAGAAPGPGLTAELLAFLAGRVAKFKLPRTIELRRRTAPRPQRQALQAAGSATPTGRAATAPSEAAVRSKREQPPRTALAVAELGPALLGEGARALLGVLAGEHGHADLGFESERLVLRPCPRSRG